MTSRPVCFFCIQDEQEVFTQPCSSIQPGLTFDNKARNEDNPDCGPNCPLLNEFLNSYALEMDALRKAFEEQKKKEETKRTNLCSRIDQKVSLLSISFIPLSSETEYLKGVFCFTFPHLIDVGF